MKLRIIIFPLLYKSEYFLLNILEYHSYSILNEYYTIKQLVSFIETIFFRLSIFEIPYS